MKVRAVILVIFFALLLTFIPVAAGSKTRIFEFSYTARIEKVPEGIKTVRLWLPYPQTDEHQEILDAQIEAPKGAAVYREPKHANLIMHVSTTHPEPFEVVMHFKVLRREYIRNDFSSIPERSDEGLPEQVKTYLKPSALVPLNEQVRQWAGEVTRGKKTDLEKARAIYDYALAHVKYDNSGSGWGRGDLLYVCDEKRGNCTDFHALFNGFARAVGIPARFSIGFSLPEKRGEGIVPGYHCWSEFYLKGYGWVPIDASEAWKNPAKREYFFGAHDENRIQFSIGRDLVLRPQQAGEPLNYFIFPYAEADGKPLREISYKFSFRDLPPEQLSEGSQ